jgi:ribulose 1,5-bisphosphate synthetase/thiazole synthase
VLGSEGARADVGCQVLMGIFLVSEAIMTLTNRLPDGIIDMCRTEDEVMELRAKLQVAGNDAHVQRTLTQKYRAEALDLKESLKNAENERDMWKKRAEELAIEKVFGRVI